MYKKLSIPKMTSLLIFILAVLILSGCTVFDFGKTRIQNNMADYLKNTYEKEFVVEKSKLSGNEGFGYNWYVADAYPKDDQSIKFTVAWYKKGVGEYNDNYLSKLWSSQGKKEVSQRLKEIYGEELPLMYEMSVDNKELKNLNHSEVISKYGNNGFCGIHYCVFAKENIDKKKEAEKAFELYKQYIIDNRIPAYIFTIYYVRLDWREEFLQKEFGHNAMLDPKKLHDENKLINVLHLGKFKNIKSADDIMNKFVF